MRMHVAFALVLAALLCGCASTSDSKSEPKTAGASDGTPYHKHGQIQLAWFADGFDFTGYDTLVIAPTKYAAKERPNEVDMRTWAVQYVQSALAEYIRTNGVFPNVTTRESDVKPGAKALRMENTIIEYEKGGGGARYWAGLFGAGQPVLKVRGEFVDGDKPLCKYEAFRHGESAGARFAGAYISDKDIQTGDINDLALDMSDFIFRARKHLPPH
jgi:hypothetical protein